MATVDTGLPHIQNSGGTLLGATQTQYTAPPIIPYFINFNQDNSSLMLGLGCGYGLITWQGLEQVEACLDSKDTEKDFKDSNSGISSAGVDVIIVERLFNSSLIAVVNQTAPRKLRICHHKKGTEICTYSYPNTILAVKLNRQRVLVVLEENLYIHNIKDMKVLHIIGDTPPNPRAVCALSYSNDINFLAYPGSSQIGEVQIFDTVNLRAVTMIPAHDSPLAAISFSPSVTRIATASEKGTVIRVFDVNSGSRIYEFRRGMKRCVTINCLSFSFDEQFLAASSNTETVHIFKLEDGSKDASYGTGTSASGPASEEPQGWWEYMGKALVTPATSFLPTQVTDVFTQGRAYAQVHLMNSSQRTVCAVIKLQEKRVVLVATLDGILFMYDLPNLPEEECKLLSKHNLLEKLHLKLPQVALNIEDGKQFKSAITTSESNPRNTTVSLNSNEEDDRPPAKHFPD